jgi:hypothetical protein
VRSVARIKAELSLPGTPVLFMRTMFVISVLSSRVSCVGENAAGDNETEFYIVLSVHFRQKIRKTQPTKFSVWKRKTN